MNEILQRALEGFLEFVQNTAQFAAEQIPQYVRELLQYFYVKYMIDAWVEVGFFLFGIVIFIGLVVGWVILIKHVEGLEYKQYDTRTNWYAGGAMISLIPLITAIVLITFSFGEAKDNFLQAYKVKNAPRVFIIEYLQQSLKK